MNDSDDTSMPFPDVWALIASMMYWAFLLREEEKDDKRRT